MKFTKWRLAAAGAGVSLFALLGSPALAGSTGAIADGNGVDYDAGCLVSTATAAPGPNSVGSPGSGCPGVTTYDGSTEGTDLSSVQLSNAAGQFTATATVDGSIPAAGNTSLGSNDLPAGNFVGSSFKVMFQNKDKETNLDNASGGCVRNPNPPGGRVRDQSGSWKDGYHYFVGFDAVWNGTKWIHSAQYGTYDPSPDGGFTFTELGTNDGSGWTNADPNMVLGTNWNVSVSGGTWSVTVDGIAARADTTNCANGVFKTVLGETGDRIANVKGLSFASETVTLPVTVPLSALCGPSGGEVCESDLTSVGGFIFYSDSTAGNSANNGLVASTLKPNIVGISYTGGALGQTDTLGDGPTCPTPTFGGTAPTNPLFVGDTACQIDDDAAGRGSLLTEFWDTTSGFTF